MVGSSDEQGMAVVDLRFESLRDLQENLGPYLSPEGFFLRDRADFSASDVLRFRLMLPGDFVLVEGVGVVVWVRTPDEAGPSTPYGAAVGFATLSDQGRELVERIVHTHVDGGGKAFEMSRPDGMEIDVSGIGEVEEPQGPDLRFSVRGQQEAPPAPTVEGVPVSQDLPFDERQEAESVADIDSGGLEWIEPESVPLTVPEGQEQPERAEGAEATTPEVASEVDPDEDRAAMPRPFDFAEGSPEAGEVLFGSPADETSAFGENEPIPSPAGGMITMPEEAVVMPDEPESVSLELGETYHSGRRVKKRGSGWVLWVVLIGVIGAGGWWLWSERPPWLTDLVGDSWFGDRGTDGVEIGSNDAIGEMSEEDLQAVVEAAVEAVTTENGDATGAGNATEAAVDVDTAQIPGSALQRESIAPVETAEAEPPGPAAAPDVVAGPADRIVQITAEPEGDGTAVLIRGNGAIDVDRVRTSELDGPPRILVRILGITERYRPLELPVGTAELRGIRIGHHPETSPPSLWIVLDRADGGARLGDIQSSGNALKIAVSRSISDGS